MFSSAGRNSDVQGDIRTISLNKMFLLEKILDYYVIQENWPPQFLKLPVLCLSVDNNTITFMSFMTFN